jgi:hypothetical protein
MAGCRYTTVSFFMAPVAAKKDPATGAGSFLGEYVSNLAVKEFAHDLRFLKN